MLSSSKSKVPAPWVLPTSCCVKSSGQRTDRTWMESVS